MGGTRFIGVFLSRLLVKEGHQVFSLFCQFSHFGIHHQFSKENNCGGHLKSWQVTLFTRGKAPITQQLPGESDQDYAEFSSKVLIYHPYGHEKILASY